MTKDRTRQWRYALAGFLAVCALNRIDARAVTVAEMSETPATQPAATQPTMQPAADLSDKTGTVATGGSGAVSTGASTKSDLTSMSLEDLMNVEVTSVSKTRQRIGDAPAAVTVISQDDIRRSGLTTLPELFRLAPGMDVGRMSANMWSVGARGNFSGLFANDLLVMMDGRTLYSPLFGGVYWDQADYVLQDLDRIEVVRGPGGTLWGANAVNGVINITTKTARDTQGWLIDGLGGNQEQQGAVRYGGQIDDKDYFRVYGKFRNFDDQLTSNNHDAYDGWQDERAGFRIDRFASPNDTLTLEGDAYTAHEGQRTIEPVLAPPYMVTSPSIFNSSGADVLGRWSHVISSTSDMSLQLYFDHFNRDQIIHYQQDTVDLDFQHRFGLDARNEIVWGFDARSITDHIGDGEAIAFNPKHRDNYLFSGFVQDGVSVIPDRLKWFVGTKLEYTSYTNFNVQPSTRLAWTPDERNTVWGAISRAVRTPARYEEDVFHSPVIAMPGQGGGPPILEVASGNRGQVPENLLAFELGYRVQPAKSLSLDLATFFNQYDHVTGSGYGAPGFSMTPLPPHVVIPLDFDNEMSGETYGVELSANWQVTDRWRLSGSYTWAQFQFHSTAIDDQPTEVRDEHGSPNNQFQLHSYVDLMKNVELNTSLYYIERINGGSAGASAPSIVRVDLGVTWRPRPELEIRGVVQNIFDDRHKEFSTATNFAYSEVPRSFYIGATARF